MIFAKSLLVSKQFFIRLRPIDGYSKQISVEVRLRSLVNISSATRQDGFLRKFKSLIRNEPDFLGEDWTRGSVNSS